MLWCRVNLEKLLVIHAGTHKTATTYIQNRLGANRSPLRENGVFLLAHETKKVGRFHAFATYLKAKNYRKIAAILKSIPGDASCVILSDERLTKVLTQEEMVAGLLEVLRRLNFKLRIVFFLRDQPDYINSLYVQEVKRLYHSRTIKSYIKRSMKSLAARFDYESMFSRLIESSEIDVQFLPYGAGGGDPFDCLMRAQSWVRDQGWEPAVSETINDQPGVKGVWLARAVRQRLVELGADLKKVRGQSRFIQKFVKKNGWSNDRYYGLSQKGVNKIRGFYRPGNDRFAMRVWGKTWDEVYPAPQRKKNIFELTELDDPLEKASMQLLVDQVIEDIRVDKPSTFEAVA